MLFFLLTLFSDKSLQFYSFKRSITSPTFLSKKELKNDATKDKVNKMRAFSTQATKFVRNRRRKRKENCWAFFKLFTRSPVTAVYILLSIQTHCEIFSLRRDLIHPLTRKMVLINPIVLFSSCFTKSSKCTAPSTHVL